MKIDLDKTGLSFDFSFCFNDEEKSSEHLLNLSDIEKLKEINYSSISELNEIREGKILSHNEKALFLDLPLQEENITAEIRNRAKYIRSNFKYVISFGIGGSYLGNIALLQALKGLHYNLGNIYPKLFFLGNNLDPQTLREIEELVDIGSLHLIIISKSGSTLEPLAGFGHFHRLMMDSGLDLQGRITIITGSSESILSQYGRENNIFTMLMPEFIGGRFSVLSVVGLLSASIAGIDIDVLLQGSRVSLDYLLSKDVSVNPALLYADMGYLFYKKEKFINVLMPYSDRLNYFGLWYIQLFSESLGKEEKGRTPLLAIGTTDMHSQTQQHQEGLRDKLITFIEIERFDDDISIPSLPSPLNIYHGSFNHMMRCALKANQTALYNDCRPSVTITMGRLNEYALGSLILFFEISTVLESIMLGINAFNQPGVEHYKKIMKGIM